MTVTEKGRDSLARPLWGETKGEGLAGQISVAYRVLDGKDRSWWGEGYGGFCLKPYQFGCWNKAT
ncbi:UNVERIFIED_ORG: hypothetical protein J2Y77_002324 [Pseudomonas lini]